MARRRRASMAARMAGSGRRRASRRSRKEAVARTAPARRGGGMTLSVALADAAICRLTMLDDDVLVTGTIICRLKIMARQRKIFVFWLTALCYLLPILVERVKNCLRTLDDDAHTLQLCNFALHAASESGRGPGYFRYIVVVSSKL